MNRLVLGLVMGFGAGVLISAVAFELVEEAFETSGLLSDVAIGLFAGCAVFFARRRPDRPAGRRRPQEHGGRQAGGSALPIVLGIVLDGIPESAVLGLSAPRGRRGQRRHARRRLPLEPARGDRGDLGARVVRLARPRILVLWGASSSSPGWRPSRATRLFDAPRRR